MNKGKIQEFYEFICFQQIGDDIDYELDSIENVKRLIKDINDIFYFEYNFTDNEIEEITKEIKSW